MDTSATASASTTSSTANYAYLPSSTQHKPRLGNTPVISHRPLQAGFPRPLPASRPALANNAPSCTGMTVLMIAAMHGDYDLAFLHGNNMPANEINRTDARGDSALILAARGGHADVVTLLLESGAAINQEDAGGNTALMQLSAKGETGMLQLLIDAGANPAHLNHAGQTAADLATEQGHYFVAASLSGIERSAVARASARTANGHPYRPVSAPDTFQASSDDAFIETTRSAALHKAIEANDMDALKRILTTYRHSGCDIPRLLRHVGKLDTKDPFFADLEGTLLMAAAHHGHETLFPVLLAVGAEIDQSLPDGTTALHIAAQQNHAPAVRSLIALGANDQVDADGDTALIFAARTGNTALVKLLLQAGADADHQNADGDTALIEATWKGDVNTVRALLEAKVYPGQYNEDRMACLMFAARDGHLEIVRMLIQAGAELNQIDNDGTSALMYAAAQGHSGIVDLLLAEGADPDRQDMKGLTALEWAQARGQDAVARVLSFPDAIASAALIEAVERNDAKMLKRLLIELRKSGVDVAQEMSKSGKLKCRNYPQLINEKMTPLMAAAYFGYRELLALLISAGATIDQSSDDGMTALLRAADNGHTATVKALLDAGADMNQPNALGGTALMHAARNGHISTLHALFQAGAPVDLVDHLGETALLKAACYGHVNVVAALLKAGADTSRVQARGLTASALAARYGHAAVAQMISKAESKPVHSMSDDKPASMNATASSTSSVASPRSSQVSPAKLFKTIERNDARALQQLLDALHASGTHIGYEVNRPGKLKNSKDRLLKDRELTPLMLAAYLGHENLLALLIDAGAIVNKFDESGRSPLIWAACQSDSNCVNALLKAGAKVDHANADEWTALMFAAERGFNGTVQALIDGGASVNRIGYPAVTALKLAAREGHILILQALIDAGARVDMTTQPGGQTALIWAAMARQTAIAQALLQAGADPHFKTYLGYKALDYAKDNRHEEMIALLCAAGKAAAKPRNKLFRKWFG